MFFRTIVAFLLAWLALSQCRPSPEDVPTDAIKKRLFASNSFNVLIQHILQQAPSREQYPVNPPPASPQGGSSSTSEPSPHGNAFSRESLREVGHKTSEPSPFEGAEQVQLTLVPVATQRDVESVKASLVNTQAFDKWVHHIWHQITSLYDDMMSNGKTTTTASGQGVHSSKTTTSKNSEVHTTQTPQVKHSSTTPHETNKQPAKGVQPSTTSAVSSTSTTSTITKGTEAPSDDKISNK